MEKFLENNPLLSTDISPSKLILIIILAIPVAVGIFLLIRYCIQKEKSSGKRAFNILKLGMVAVGPMLIAIKYWLSLELPLWIFVAASIILTLIVIVWNILTFSVLPGIAFSIFHILFGIIFGATVLGLAVAAVFFIILKVLGVLSVGGTASTSSGGGVPKWVRDVNSNEIYQVFNFGGTLQILRDSDYVVIRPGVYDGRYIDDSRNEYLNDEGFG